jgi:myo-inositol-1-phosphate synthase
MSRLRLISEATRKDSPGVPLKCKMAVEVWHSPNSAGVVIDAAGCAKLALDRGIGGALIDLELFYGRRRNSLPITKRAHRT